MMLSSAEIKALARQAGFHDCGVAPAVPSAPCAEALRQWLSLGYQASMRYMEAHEAMRSAPALLLPGCRTVVSVVLGYKPARVLTGSCRLASYAYGRDYHEVMKEKLWALLAALRQGRPALQGRPFVDTAPISDRHWAVQAGLGWQGRNSLFVHPRYGSFVFLGELLLLAEADAYDSPLAEAGREKLLFAAPATSSAPVMGAAVDKPSGAAAEEAASSAEGSALPYLCGGCQACVAACPNQAIRRQQVGDRAVYMVDARRCSSYHTIENRAPQLPAGLHLAGYVFGCDCCQSVCPFNRQAPVSLTLSDERQALLSRLPEADEATFRQAAAHSTLSRIGYPQWQRNVARCLAQAHPPAPAVPSNPPLS